MKTAIISQARSTSTRLPAKVLKKIKGKSTLSYHLERLEQSALPIIVATTTNTEDDAIAAIAKSKKLSCFRGDEDDVLGRYYEAAKQFELDCVVRVTSDCPLIDGKFLAEGLQCYETQRDHRSYLGTGIRKSVPLGFSFEIFSFELLEEAHERAKEKGEREHVTPYMRFQKNSQTKLIPFGLKEDHSDLRVTLDTEEDFRLIKTLIEDYEADQKSLPEIISILRKQPELVHINQHVHQKAWNE